MPTTPKPLCGDQRNTNDCVCVPGCQDSTRSSTAWAPTSVLCGADPPLCSVKPWPLTAGSVGVAVGVLVAAAVGLGAGVRVGVGVAVEVGVEEGAGVTVRVGVVVAVAVDVALGVGGWSNWTYPYAAVV